MNPKNILHINERITHVISIDINSGTYLNYDEAVNAANALKDFLMKTCKKYDYHCIGIIGVSRYDSHFGKMSTSKYGKRVFKADLPNYSGETSPHLHVLLVANPASQLKNIIESYLHKKHGRKVTWSRIADEYYDKKIAYILEQSEKLRTIDLPSEELNPYASAFIELTEHSLCELGNTKALFPQLL